MDKYDNWINININVLNHLYYKMIQISKIHGINIINTQESFDNFVYMMYNESSREVINRQLYPEYFDIMYNSSGYEDYKILDIT
jgi:hypothetical protein